LSFALPFGFLRARVADLKPNPELLRSLGRLARGLSCLFWGLPIALLICAQAVRTEWLRSMGVVPALLATGLLLYGVWQMAAFQPQERVWTAALWRTRLLATINFGLSPFLYWWGHVPRNLYFLSAILLFGACSIAFLGSLNSTIKRLGAMLPDETLRAETRQFTTVNLWLLFLLACLMAFFIGAAQSPELSDHFSGFLELADRHYRWLVVSFVLLPVAMTMALLWKTKEVILESVFGGRF
jgi:hypothetical protein